MRIKIAAALAGAAMVGACQQTGEFFNDLDRRWSGQPAAEAEQADGPAQVASAADGAVVADRAIADAEAQLEAAQAVGEEPRVIDLDVTAREQAAAAEDAALEAADDGGALVEEGLAAGEATARAGDEGFEAAADAIEEAASTVARVAALADDAPSSMVEANGYSLLTPPARAAFMSGRAFSAGDGSVVAYAPDGRRFFRSAEGEAFESRWRDQDGQFCEETAPAIWNCHVGETFLTRDGDLRVFDSEGAPIARWTNTARVGAP